MTHIEEYYHKFLDQFVDKNNPSLNNRENVRKYSAYAFQPTLNAFIHLETELHKEFDEKLAEKTDNNKFIESRVKSLENALRNEFDKKLSAKAYENTMLEKDVMALKSEVETLKKALADTLAALAAK
jgi:hypothetical protein